MRNPVRKVQHLKLPPKLRLTADENQRRMKNFVQQYNDQARGFSYVTARGLRSKYMPHQGEQEMARRRRQMGVE